MQDLVKDGRGATTVDFFLEKARIKMDTNSQAIINRMSGASVSGDVLSVGMESIKLRTSDGDLKVLVSDILDMS